MSNATQNISLVFVPLVVRSHATDIEVHTNANDHCGKLSDPNRATSNCWFTTEKYRDGSAVAHEFGHLIGAADEYSLPATANEIPPDTQKKMKPEDIKLSTYEGITGKRMPFKEGGYDVMSLMGQYEKSQEVDMRHVQRLVDAINIQLSGIGLPPYILKKL